MRTRTKGWLLLLPVAALLGVAISAQGQAGENALDIYLEEHPAALEEGTLGPLEARMLEAMTPEQAEAYAGGADPAEIVLEGGETLAELMAGLLAGGKGLVYVPLDSCLVFRTFDSTAGAMAAEETRAFFVRGATTDLSAQGGSATGCLVPTEAVAVAMHFRVRVMSAGVVGRLRVGRSGGPMPNRAMEYLRQGPDGGHAGLSVFGLCEGTCTTGEFRVRTEAAAAQVRGDVIGYFRAIEAADIPGGVSGGDADTLDGLDSTDFALTSHTHDGGDITSGTVGEPYIDPLIARDDEILPTVLASDGAGSGLDADLLDGKQLTAFRPRPQNVVLVDAGGGGDFTTLGAALASITTATTSNRFLVRVADGTYTEQVGMKPFVDIEGKGKHLTVITSATCPTVEGADDAELRYLEVECDVAGAADSAIAIRNLGVSPMLTELHINASNGNVDNTGVLNDGAAAMPMLDHVWIYAGALPTVTDIAVRNVNGAAPTIRNSGLSGLTAAIRNEDTATAKIANTQLMGDADVAVPATQSSYMCVRAYDAGTLVALNAECFPNTPPTATDDAYAGLGNTLLEVTLDYAGAASADNTTASQPSVIGETTSPKTYRSVFENDTDAETADKNQLTAAVLGATVTPGAVVNMYDDGTFEYTPPVGFTGPDTFDYTVTDPGGLADTGTVTVTVSSLIWFVDNTNGGTADGRSTTPYTSLAPIDAGGGDDGKDGTGDTIFVFTGSGSTGDGILLEASQVLQGNEIALAPAGFEYAGGGDLVAAGTAPTLGNAAGDVVELADGNTVRGLDIGATNGLAITGTGVAGATIDEVGTSSTGSGNGVLLDGVTGTLALTDLDINSSNNWGIAIQNSSATFTFDAASSITNPTGVPFSVVSGAPNVTYSGTITNSSILSINVTSTTGGSVLFDGSSITGTRVALSTVGGNVTVDAASTTLDNSASTGISITGASTGTFRFDDVTISSPTNSGIDINGGAGDTFTGTVDFNNVDVTTTNGDPVVSIAGLGATAGGVDFDAASSIGSTNGGIAIDSNAGGTIAFNGPATLNTAALPAVNATSNSGVIINFFGNLDLDTTTGTGFNATGGGIVQATNVGNTVDTVGGVTLGNGTGVNIGAEIGALGVGFSSVNVGSSGKANSGILLTNTGNAGTFSVTGGTIQNTTNRAFSAANVDGTVSIGASLQNDGGRSVEITGSAGAITFSGAIDDDAEGIDISTNTGTFTFQGGLDIDSGANTGFSAGSGGTLNICADDNCSSAGGTAVVNTIDVGAAIGLTVSSVNIDSEGLTFERISSSGGANVGIVLNSTGTAAGNGSLTVTGDGSTAASGGTIAGKTGAGGSTSQGIGIFLSNTKSPSFSFMQLNDFSNFAIRGAGVTGFNLADSTINGTNGDSTTANEGSVSFTNLLGSATITDSNISGGHEDNVVVINDTGTLDRLTVSGGTIGLNATATGNDGVAIESRSSAIAKLSVLGTSFLGARGDMVQCNAVDTSTMDCVIKDNTFANAHTNIASGGGGITVSGGGASANIALTYEVSGTTAGSQTFTGAKGFAITANIVSGAGTATGTIRNNYIGTPGVAGSGSTEGGGILAAAAGTVTHTVTIDGNRVRRIGLGGGTASGIDIVANVDNPGGTRPQMNATVTGNNVAELEGSGGFAGMNLTVAGNGTENGILCVDARTNVFDASGGTFAGAAVFLSQFNAASNYNLPGYGGSANGEFAFACAPGTASAGLSTFLTSTNGNTLVDGPFPVFTGVDALTVCGVSGTGSSCP